MPRITKPEFAGDLTALFIPLEPRSLSPDEISSTLQLTHPFLPGTHRWRAFEFCSVVAAINVLTVQGPISGPDEFWYIHSCDVGSSDAVVQGYSIAVLVRNPVGAVSINIKNTLNQTGNVAGGRVAIERPLLPPPNSNLICQGSAITAGNAPNRQIDFRTAKRVL